MRAVQLLKDDEVWKAAQQGLWRRDLLDAALARSEKAESEKKPEEMKACLGLVEYRDGFTGRVIALNEVVGVPGRREAEGRRSGSDALLHPCGELE